MNEKVAEMKDRLREALELRGKKSNDLVNDLKIPASAISQYLKGKSKNMSSDRLYDICKYLDVSEPWMMGYDVTRERMTQEKNDIIADAVVRMRYCPDYLKYVEAGLYIEDSDLPIVNRVISSFSKNPND